MFYRATTSVAVNLLPSVATKESFHFCIPPSMATLTEHGKIELSVRRADE
jgi:hypothetical protein